MRPIQEKFFEEFPLPAGFQVKKTREGGWSLQTEDFGVFDLDFEGRPLFSRQALFKAIGFKGPGLKVLDITAGWAREAFLLSQIGCQVTAVESHPFVFHFVRSFLERSSSYPRRLRHSRPLRESSPSKPKHLYRTSIKLLWDESLNHLSQLKTENEPDVIYMDPMFGEKKKSLGKKNMQILKKLVGETKNQKALLEMALQKAKKRVVVKRQRREPSLHKPVLHSFKSRTICYDVFQPKKRPML